jgi:hypothetical protein
MLSAGHGFPHQSLGPVLVAPLCLQVNAFYHLWQGLFPLYRALLREHCISQELGGLECWTPPGLNVQQQQLTSVWMYWHPIPQVMPADSYEVLKIGLLK